MVSKGLSLLWPLHAVSRNLCTLPVHVMQCGCPCGCSWGCPCQYIVWRIGSTAVSTDVCMCPFQRQYCTFTMCVIGRNTLSESICMLGASGGMCKRQCEPMYAAECM